MKYVTAILNTIITAAQNKWVWLRFTVLVIVGFAGAILFSRTKKEDCTKVEQELKEVKEQNREFIRAFIEIKKDLQPTSAALFDRHESAPIFASIADTVPKRKITAQVQRVLSKIDSILLKIKRDSITKKQLKS